MAAVQKAHIAIADGLKMKNTEAAQNTVLASALMPGSTDVSGTVTFTQVTDGKATVRGIAGFHGDFSVLSKTMPITDVTMQRQIVASGVETGAVAENMARANEFIREQYTKPSTLPSGTVAPQFDMGTYQTYLLTGALPSTFGIIISTATRANYRAARAALSGATCWNDVHLLGYPQLAILIPGQKASRQPNNPIITPADKAIQQGHSAAGNKLANNG